VIEELQRRAREPITNLRSFARACISRDPDQWLQIATGETDSDDDVGWPSWRPRDVSPWQPHV